MRFKAGNPQDYNVFPSLYKYYEAFNSRSTISHFQTQLLSNRWQESPSPSPSGQGASYSPIHVLPSEKWLGSSQQPLQLPTNVLGDTVFTLCFWLLIHLPAAWTKGLIYSLRRPFANGLTLTAGTWLPSPLPFHSNAKGREVSARAPVRA